ncbi:MAG: biopolymer transporter ExbD [Limnoraphis robusta]|jgi:biopolymer transport protein ExbD|nr:biopolymer transporter ExbD [Limnoraphis sp. WC205]
MKLNFDSSPDDARIELLPLIDVVFCILTFFILAALQLTRQQAINVDLPKATTGETQIQKMLIVGIDDQGRTYIDQQAVNDQQLDRALQRFRRWNPNGLMVLYAPKDARYNDVVQVLDKLRAVGGERVALATLPSSAELPTQSNPTNLVPPGSPDAENPLLPAFPEGSDAPPPNPFLLSPPPSDTPGANPVTPNLGGEIAPLDP